MITRQIEWDIDAVGRGEMSQAEFLERAKYRVAGAATGASLVLPGP